LALLTMHGGVDGENVQAVGMVAGGRQELVLSGEPGTKVPKDFLITGPMAENVPVADNGGIRSTGSFLLRGA
jgi:hypothetical protein